MEIRAAISGVMVEGCGESSGELPGDLRLREVGVVIAAADWTGVGVVGCACAALRLGAVLFASGVRGGGAGVLVVLSTVLRYSFRRS